MSKFTFNILNIIILLVNLSYINSNSFQFELFKSLSTSSNKSSFISPISIYETLSLCSNGALGITRKTLLKVLGQDNITSLNKENELIINIIENIKELKIANAVLSKYYPSEYFKLKANRYKAYCSVLENNWQVNSWFSRKTDGRIDEILNNIRNIDLIILNGIYLYSDWKDEFNSDYTTRGSFYVNKDKIKIVDMMFNSFNNPKYYEDEDTQVIELPYKNENLSAIIILPKLKEINKYINSINEDKFINLVNNIQTNKCKVDLFLPKFEINYSFSLKNDLIKIGLDMPFKRDRADFGNIVPNSIIYITDVLNKGYLKVAETKPEEEDDETEEELTTMVKIKRMIPFHLKTNGIMMKVNKAFLLIIKHKKLKNNFLFIGKITDI